MKALFHDLQIAVEIEWATLPTYLYAYWSLQDPGCEDARLLISIISQEMLHLGMACNLMNSLGGSPVFSAKTLPKYPGHLPGHAPEGNFKVHLRRYGAPALRTFLDIERPEDHTCQRRMVGRLHSPDSWRTIGEFYSDIRDILRDLPEIRFQNRRQLAMSRPHAPGTLYAMTDATAAGRKAQSMQAIEEIIVQGEGGPGEHERSHFQKFTLLAEQLPVAPPAVYPVVDDPDAHLSDYSVEQKRRNNTFNAAYSDLVDNLQAAFTSEQPRLYTFAGPTMLRLGGLAAALRQTGPIPGHPEQHLPGPTFQYIDATER